MTIRRLEFVYDGGEALIYVKGPGREGGVLETSSAVQKTVCVSFRRVPTTGVFDKTFVFAVI